MSSASLPPLDEQGLLPDGVHQCDMIDMRRHFVEAFPESRSRPDIYRGFSAFRSDLESNGVAALQWVDGSFVTAKLEPGDIDVVHFADASLLNGLPHEAQSFLRQVIDEAYSKNRYRTHVKIVGVPEPNHPDRQKFEAARQYWRKWWGGVNPKAQASAAGGPSRSTKGFLAIGLGSEEAVPSVSTAL